MASTRTVASALQLSDGLLRPTNIRVSTGLSLQWLSPMGPLVFVLAKPIKIRRDDTEVFSFNIGRTF